jgi:DNA (cytosine-5)-methyltransferase 1
MSAPRLLDLFCGAGGAGRGYQLAGFRVTGVDIAPQPNYAGERFIRADALEFLAAHGHEFDAVHASPPCQAYTLLNHYNHKDYPDLVAPTRELLVRLSVPWVMENVPQAPLRDPVRLCGAMFGIGVYRHRDFESSHPITAPAHPRHVARCVRNGYLPGPDQFMTVTGGKHSQAWQRAAASVMGLDWIAVEDGGDLAAGIREVCEAIPPAFTAWIGTQLITQIRTRRAGTPGEREVAA